jgi:hypothetical protein
MSGLALTTVEVDEREVLVNAVWLALDGGPLGLFEAELETRAAVVEGIRWDATCAQVSLGTAPYSHRRGATPGVTTIRFFMPGGYMVIDAVVGQWGLEVYVMHLPSYEGYASNPEMSGSRMLWHESRAG